MRLSNATLIAAGMCFVGALIALVIDAETGFYAAEFIGGVLMGAGLWAVGYSTGLRDEDSRF